MNIGYLIDGIRFKFRHPSEQAIACWPDDTRMVDTDAGKIRVRDTGGNKPSIVMVPDGPCVIEHFEPLINDLATDFRVVCFDMPGVGFSFPDTGFDFGINQSETAVISVLDALNIQRTILSFSCVNSYVAMAVAKNNPERISRLVLAQTPSVEVMTQQWVDRNISPPLRIPVLGQLINVALLKQMTDKWFDIALPKDSLLKTDFVHHALSAQHTGGCFCLASVVQGMMHTDRQTLTGVEVPTTMVWGNKDWSHKNTSFESFLTHIPHCNIKEFDACGHFPNLEQPKLFAKLIRETQS